MINSVVKCLCINAWFYLYDISEIKFICESYNFQMNYLYMLENPLAVEECESIYILLISSSGK